MDLILMPVLASLVGIALFIIAAVIGGTMQLAAATAGTGKRILIYSACSLAGGLALCWIGFAIMLLLPSWDRHSIQFGNVIVSLPIAVFWVSGPSGMILGAILARGFLRKQ